MDWLIEQFELSPTQDRLLQTALLLVGVLLVRWVVLAVVHRRIEDAQVWFRTRKTATYLASFMVVVGFFQVWLGGLTGALTYIGIVSAGIAIALADVLKNLAGWAYILARRPFRVGDRVEVNGRSGDVVDIRVFRFTMLEIGNWVGADQSTGRLIHVPNGVLFTESIANYSEGFPFLWDELPVLVTFESDWELGERLILELVTAQAPDVKTARYAEQIKRAAHDYFIRYTHLEPTTYLSVEDSGVLITGRYLVAVRERRKIKQDMWRALLKAFEANPTLELAYPTVRTYLPDPIRMDQGERPEAAK